MRTLIAAMLILAAPVSLAAPNPTYAPAWDNRAAPAVATRRLVGEANYLDRTATSLFRDIQARNGRSELTSRARELAQATADFRRLAEHGAPAAQLNASLQRVSNRYAYLERRLDTRERQKRLRYAFAGLNQVDQAIRQTSASLQRFARDSRYNRQPDRYAYNAPEPQHAPNSPGRVDARRDGQRHENSR